MWDVTADRMADGTAGYIQAKLSTPTLELNLRFEPGEAAALTSIADADWERRGSLRLGRILGYPVFWSAIDGQVSLLIGADDESWEIAVTDMPLQTVHLLVAEVGHLDTSET